jgi:hypothetical protein
MPSLKSREFAVRWMKSRAISAWLYGKDHAVGRSGDLRRVLPGRRVAANAGGGSGVGGHGHGGPGVRRHGQGFPLVPSFSSQ